MEITPKAMRRAQTRLLKQAEAEAKENKITVTDALLNILEDKNSAELVKKAFAQSPTLTPKPDFPDY